MKSHVLFATLLFFTAFLVRADLVDKAMPLCTAKIEGGSKGIDFKSFKGKVILIDFWATWCPPCKQSMPFLNAMRNELVFQGFEIIAINVDEDRREVERFLSSQQVDYQLAYDNSGECPEMFEVKAMPSSYFVDRKGVIRAIHLGYRDNDRKYIRSKIDELLAEK